MKSPQYLVEEFTRWGYCCVFDTINMTRITLARNRWRMSSGQTSVDDNNDETYEYGYTRADL